MPRARKVDFVGEREAAPEIVGVRCVVANVWTSNGKLFRGDEDEVTRAEAEALGAMVEILR